MYKYQESKRKEKMILADGDINDFYAIQKMTVAQYLLKLELVYSKAHGSNRGNNS